MTSNAILALDRQAYIAVLRNEIRKYEVPVYGFIPMHHRIMADKKRAELDLIVSTSFPEPGGGAGVTEVLTQAEELHAKALKPGCDAWVKALQAARKANDPDPAIVEGIVALEAIEKAAKEAQALLRQKILASCDDSGVTGFFAGPYEVSRVRGKRSAEVTDETALRTAHPELFEPQPDKLNKSELTKALRKGAVIAGAVMGEPGIGHIMIKARAR